MSACNDMEFTNPHFTLASEYVPGGYSQAIILQEEKLHSDIIHSLHSRVPSSTRFRKKSLSSFHDDEDMEDLLNDLCNDDDNKSDMKTPYRPINSTPLSSSFKMQSRLANDVVRLNETMSKINRNMESSSKSLRKIEHLLKQQTEQQKMFTEYIKRNSQLLKILVEYKCGKRSKPSRQDT